MARRGEIVHALVKGNAIPSAAPETPLGLPRRNRLVGIDFEKADYLVEAPTARQSIMRLPAGDGRGVNAQVMDDVGLGEVPPLARTHQQLREENRGAVHSLDRTTAQYARTGFASIPCSYVISGLVTTTAVTPMRHNAHVASSSAYREATSADVMEIRRERGAQGLPPRPTTALGGRAAGMTTATKPRRRGRVQEYLDSLPLLGAEPQTFRPKPKAVTPKTKELDKVGALFGVQPLAYSVPQAAALLGIGRTKGWELVRRGKLVAHRHEDCDRIVVFDEDVRAYAARLEPYVVPTEGAEKSN